MLRVVIAILVLLLLYFSYQLFRDDPLLPEAEQWLELTNQQPDLDNNAIIYLLGLNNTGADYTGALQRYQQALQSKTYKSSPLHYPKLPGLQALDLATLNCELATPDCQQQMLTLRSETEVAIKQYRASLDAFYQLANFSNFTNIDTFITEPDFDNLARIYRLAASEIYYLIADNKLDKAASKLASLLTIERLLMRNSGEIILHVLPITNTESLYQPLIVKLHQAGYAEWVIFDTAFTPLSSTERLMNTVWQHEFANQVNAIQNALQSQQHFNLSFKPNMTVNILTQAYRIRMLDEEIAPHAILPAIAESEELIEAFNQRAKMASQLWRHVFYNYRNIVGSLLAYTAAPRFIEIIAPKLEMDLRLRLVHAMVHGTAVADLNTERYRNPYTGQAPYLAEGKLCHKLAQEICVPWPHGQQPILKTTEH